MLSFIEMKDSLGIMHKIYINIYFTKTDLNKSNP